MSGVWRSLVTCGDVCSVTFKIHGLILPGEGDEEDAGGFIKTFLEKPCVSQMSGGSGFPQNGLASRQGCKKVGVTLVDWKLG